MGDNGLQSVLPFAFLDRYSPPTKTKGNQSMRWIEYEGTIVNLAHVVSLSVRQQGNPNNPNVNHIIGTLSWGFQNFHSGEHDATVRIGNSSSQEHCEQGIKDIIAGKYDMVQPTN